ncbi:hypothetical protein SDC9_59395 [bioreactor metagenome]|uniref:Uncharacterized protein n=1 Tax=bioreactor metagenome TaxID=1076179 RepID=A0A644XA47_9ZZZZ
MQLRYRQADTVGGYAVADFCPDQHFFSADRDDGRFLAMADAF